MKKAFTLVELLAVIAVLAIIALVTTPVITNIISDSKNNLNTTQSKEILRAADVWGAKNVYITDANQPSIGSVKIQTLINDGYLDKDVTDVLNKTKNYNNCAIIISYSDNQLMYSYSESGCPNEE